MTRLKIGFPWSAGSSPAVRTTLGFLALLPATACDRRPDSGPVVVSAIESERPSRRLSFPTRLLTDATEQGLVRFDAAGQVEPGLAERWIVTDEARSYIFRIRPARWADGRPVTAEQVAAALRRRLAGNPLSPYLTAVREVVSMTPQVLEVRLERQRPDLLKLFAQPELAVARAKIGGTGPMRLIDDRPRPVLRPATDPTADPVEPRPEDEVELTPERAAKAIARYAARRTDLVSGGGFADWPLLATVEIRPAEVRVDPAVGLFGLAVTSRDGFLADAANRIALSQALDRTAITAAVAPAWEPAERILPDALYNGVAPPPPAWAALPLGRRRAEARARVAESDEPVRLRVALPAGPGATSLYARIAASLASIGVASERVAWSAPADLRLVDEVAPYDSARWYLATACQPCSVEATDALEAARLAPTPAQRAVELARADRLVAEDGAFIPIARPFRWSLVSPRLRQWQPNARAWHPLNRLRPEAR
ncbi:MAG TPA: ABC transporter substrate-binding protein [Sphingomonas sp.]